MSLNDLIDTLKLSFENKKGEFIASLVMMGQYGGRAIITVERIAQNLNDSTRYGLADNNGRFLQDQLTVPDGPAAYYSTLPIRAGWILT